MLMFVERLFEKKKTNDNICFQHDYPIKIGCFPNEKKRNIVELIHKCFLFTNFYD